MTGDLAKLDATGEVLVAGGTRDRVISSSSFSTAELRNPTTNDRSAAGDAAPSDLL
ncbi:hypothetical protein [Sorangium cellulosum]|uniref:hypothetical protein n=1 Tax=Sorangium cellulosum TaxID=56 RepID=UPI0013319A85|nr:hypothetical protein [Sorangium cellulosum]